jgi:hypothetical protein
MATTIPDTADMTLTAPGPVAAIAAEKAAGLVPLEDAQKTQLEAKAEAFVSDLVAQDANAGSI